MVTKSCFPTHTLLITKRGEFVLLITPCTRNAHFQIPRHVFALTAIIDLPSLWVWNARQLCPSPQGHGLIEKGLQDGVMFVAHSCSFIVALRAASLLGAF